ncbi:MAG: response regulator [Spirochaetia bacterium]|nr:response regulator [Spirochaetia bacterium]
MNNKNVLLVDDSILTRKQLGEILEEAGCRIKEYAVDGIDALEKFRLNQDFIDLVTLDITMPKMDGIETLREIMKIKPDAKVYMVSSMGKDQIIKECMSLGASGFIVKPFYKKKIFETILSVSA